MNPDGAPEQEAAPELSEKEKLEELVALFQRKREKEFGGDPLNDEKVLLDELDKRRKEEDEFRRRSSQPGGRHENAA